MVVLAVFKPNRNTKQDMDMVKKFPEPARFYFSQDMMMSSQDIVDAVAGTFSLKKETKHHFPPLDILVRKRTAGVPSSTPPSTTGSNRRKSQPALNVVGPIIDQVQFKASSNQNRARHPSNGFKKTASLSIVQFCYHVCFILSAL